MATSVVHGEPLTAEHSRLATSSELDPGPWKAWGAYLSERAWGTVREDYSPDGTAWEYLPHDHARSRAYRWSEDGLAGYCDSSQRLCLALTLWNGADPILKERIFGLTGNEGNHGEDAKEYWWYLDATPTHSWLRWRYHYPQRAFPYEQLRVENERRGKDDPEYELLDTGVFDDDRYWCVTVEYAKAAPGDTCMRITVRNEGPDTATIDVAPTLWFRNTWSWEGDRARPSIMRETSRFVARHEHLGTMVLNCGACEGVAPSLLVCDNETNTQRLFDVAPDRPAFPKDAINDEIVGGHAATNPDGRGTKAAAHYALTVAGGAEVEIRLRLTPNMSADLAASFDDTMRDREREADEFYAAVTPADLAPDEAMIVRQASAGMIWGQQFFHFDVARWLDGDPAQPPPPAERGRGRNSAWRHLNAHDIMSMPDPWEYPWFASWDLAFHCVALAHVDPEFAKHQLVLLCREWFMHPNGQLPAYEWAFGDANPPVHAWAALRVFEIDGCRDREFLARVFQKLMINFTWWVNHADSEGDNVFEGGFLGLDNVGPFDRSAPLPIDGLLEQSDGTAWMAMYCLNLLEMALTLASSDRAYEDIATKFFEHFAYISTAMNTMGLWDDVDGFYYDVIRDGSETRPLRVRSVVGLVPLFAVMVIEPDLLARLDRFQDRVAWFVTNRPEFCASVSQVDGRQMRTDVPLILSIVPAERLARVLRRVLDPAEFLSDHGLRSVSRWHLEHPFELALASGVARVDYEPAESRTGLFGGNSNWRGPVWMPINALTVEALRRFDAGLGSGFSIEHPSGSANAPVSLGAVADDVTRRLVALFRDDVAGRRPAFGDVGRMQHDVRWHDQLLFHEYFHGDTGAGLGASHQTGWTGLVIDLLLRRSAQITGRGWVVR